MKKNTISLLCLCLWIAVYSQSHTIEIHPNGNVASLLMEPTEYNDWVTNGEFQNNSKREALVQDIYQKFDDNFDFIFFVLNEDNTPSGISSGQLIQVSNDIQGIGLNLFDNSSQYGSAGKLKAVMQLGRRINLVYGPALHELMHNWGNFGIDTEGTFNNVDFFNFMPHWGVTGGNTKGQLGGFEQGTLVDNGSNSYTVDTFGNFANGANTVKYNELELYLMGMIPKEDVSDFDVFKGISNYDTSVADKVSFTASTRNTFTPALLESTLGTRFPSSINSQKDFKLLIIVLTSAPLTINEWDVVDNHSINFGLNGVDAFSSNYNFWEATNGLGTIETNNLQNSTLGLASFNIDNDVFVYPNPTSNIFNLRFSNANDLNFIVTDYTGKIIITKKNITQSKYSLDMTKYSSGIYFLQINNKGRKVTKKLILN